MAVWHHTYKVAVILVFQVVMVWVPLFESVNHSCDAGFICISSDLNTEAASNHTHTGSEEGICLACLFMNSWQGNFQVSADEYLERTFFSAWAVVPVDSLILILGTASSRGPPL